MDKRAVVRWQEVESSSAAASVAPTRPRPGVSEPRERLLALRSPRRPNVPLRNSACRMQISNRKIPLLESSVSHCKQTTASRSNRQFLRPDIQGSQCRPPFVLADEPGRSSAILFPRRSAWSFLCVSAVSDFAAKIAAKPRDITRHTMPSNFVRNSMKTKNRCTNYSTHFSRVSVAPYFLQSAAIRPQSPVDLGRRGPRSNLNLLTPHRRCGNFPHARPREHMK
jgi:hypothetical protein